MLPEGRIARSIFTLASGTAVAQIITICAMPIVTRLYTPTQIGVISLFLAFFNFWAPALSLRYEYALLIAKNDAESHVINRLAVFCVVGTSILAVPMLATLHHFRVLGFGLLPPWAPIAVMPILLGYGQFMVCRSWGLRAGVMNDITKATMARSAANVVTRVGLGVIGCGLPGLFVAELAGAWGPAATLYRSVHRHFASSRPTLITREMMRVTMQRYIKFPTLETPSTFVNQLGLTLPVPMIAALYGPAAAGWFGLARAMVGIPNTQIGSAIGDVFQRELASAIVDGDFKRGKKMFYKMLAKLSLFGLVPLIGVVTLAPWIMGAVFGSAWRETGSIAAIIAPWLYLALIASSLSRALSVLQAQEFKLIYDVTSVIFYTVVFAISKLMALKILEMVAALSGACVLNYLLYLAIIRHVIERKLPGE